MRSFQVASGLIFDGAQMLLVQNRRRNGSLDWSTPGGVVDPGETPIAALSREVHEETRISVDAWSPVIYTVEVEFVEIAANLTAEVRRSTGWFGDVEIDDPDGVVVDGAFYGLARCRELLAESPQWLSEPLLATLDVLGSDDPASAALPLGEKWAYQVAGSLTSPDVARVHAPPGRTD